RPPFGGGGAGLEALGAPGRGPDRSAKVPGRVRRAPGESAGVRRRTGRRSRRSAMGTVVVTDEQIREAVPMADAVAAVRRAFADLAAGAFEIPVRAALGGGAFLSMPVHHRPSGTAAVKTLSLNFDRTPAITGTVVWSDVSRTGGLAADAGALTALRTGAASGVATDLLADPGASRLALIGAGGQAADQVRAVHAVRPLSRLTVTARTPARAEALVASLRAELPGVESATAPDPAAAVAGADVVCCATNTAEPLFAAADLPERVHVNAIGSYWPGMRELPDDLLAAATVVVDDEEAVLEESGEILHALGSGAIDRGDLVELGTALDGGLPERAPRTVFKSVGVAVQDWALARLLAERFLP